jgi:hypothetical protein
MAWIQRIIEFVASLFAPRKKTGTTLAGRDVQLPEILFKEIIVTDKTPSNSAVVPRQFIEVVSQNIPRWVMFKCPCSCGETISLPLQAPHNPRWSVSPSAAGRPDLYPSVWRNKGCMSHFWIEDGRVFWCDNSGVAPHAARPDLYLQRNNRVSRPEI